MTELLKDLSVDFNEIDIPLRQVIVNTHSPVFVGNMEAWKNNNNVSIWYAQMRNTIIDVNNQRLKLNVTKISPVLKDNSTQQLSLVFSEQDRKITLSLVNDYLKTAQFEDSNIE
jgi:hypothetical protein